MKLIFTILIAVISGVAIAQTEYIIPQNLNPKNFYLSDEFCAGKGLEPGQINSQFRVWNSLEANAKYQRVVDIRWYFKTPEQAAKYLKDNLDKESEHGDPVKSIVPIPGVSNLYEFTEGAKQREMNKAFGLKLNMFYFLFTVQNYAAKVFISSENDITLEDAAIIAKEAASRLNAAIH